jgi:hypothetical protein
MSSQFFLGIFNDNYINFVCYKATNYGIMIESGIVWKVSWPILIYCRIVCMEGLRSSDVILWLPLKIASLLALLAFLYTVIEGSWQTFQEAEDIVIIIIIICHSVLDTVGICVAARYIRKFYTFSINSALRHSASARCTIAVNDVCKLLDIFSKNNVSFHYTLVMLETA